MVSKRRPWSAYAVMGGGGRGGWGNSKKSDGSIRSSPRCSSAYVKREESLYPVVSIGKEVCLDRALVEP